MSKPEVIIYSHYDESAAFIEGLINNLGCSVRRCTNAPETLSLCAELKPSLLIVLNGCLLLNGSELIERLRSIVNTEFVRLSYTDGIKILEEAVAGGHKFEFPVYWGVDLASEHERYLVETHFKRPVILTDYPKDIKAFYMKQNDDGKTVRAMDVLFPKIGEIIGGSEREADYDKLLKRIEEMNIPMKDMWWYLDTRRYGSCPHSGFGLGFERLLLFVTGMANIRDVIPFPRTPNNAEF